MKKGGVGGGLGRQETDKYQAKEMVRAERGGDYLRAKDSDTYAHAHT